MNREQRRAREQGAIDPKHGEQRPRKPIAGSTPQDVGSARAKGRRHGKVTADKWNQ